MTWSETAGANLYAHFVLVNFPRYSDYSNGRIQGLVLAALRVIEAVLTSEVTADILIARGKAVMS